MTPRSAGAEAGARPATARGSARADGDPAAAASFLEVRVRPGQVEVMEFHSHGRAAELAAALRRLGLDLVVEFDSPCG